MDRRKVPGRKQSLGSRSLEPHPVTPGRDGVTKGTRLRLSALKLKEHWAGREHSGAQMVPKVFLPLQI